ncbi:MAG: glycosyltransferase [Rhodobacteraceae bacterium]|nr:glycosyltransferase [Paracoccaceae bacterium]
MNALLDRGGKPSASGCQPCGGSHHFIAINHHRFHDQGLVAQTVHSVLSAAKLLAVARPHEGIRIVFFHQPSGLTPSIIERFERLSDVEMLDLPPGSNGEGLNRQIDIAKDMGAVYFYRVDADDPVASERFLRQAKLLDQSGADVVGGGLVYTNLRSGTRFRMLPPRHPTPLHYLTNSAMLHPTLAFRLQPFCERGLRYWPERLEDKHLGLQIAQHGLKLVNDPENYGVYHLNPQARSSFASAMLNLRLNLAMIRHMRRFDLLPLAFAFFTASATLPSQSLRMLRHYVSWLNVLPNMGSKHAEDSAVEMEQEEQADYAWDQRK